MKRILLTVVICLIVLAAASFLTGFWNDSPKINVTRVGFVYSEDESTPYSANFAKARHALEEEYGDKVEILFESNVHSRDSEQPIRDLIRKGVRILFINLDSDIPVTLAREFPDVQFCQVSLPTIGMDGTPENYHTFNGEIYQARYVSGAAAGRAGGLCRRKREHGGDLRLHGIPAGRTQRSAGGNDAGAVYRQLEQLRGGKGTDEGTDRGRLCDYCAARQHNRLRNGL